MHKDTTILNLPRRPRTRSSTIKEVEIKTKVE